MKPLQACYYICNKAFYCGPDAKAEEPKTPCWCLKTSHPVGPDGREVNLKACGPGRACFRPEVEL